MTHLTARTLCGDRQGVAAVEFALTGSLLTLLMAGIVDFGFAFNAKLALANATTAAAEYAYANGSGVTTPDLGWSLIQNTTAVAQAAGANGKLTVSVTLNGATDGSNAASTYCLSGESPGSAVLTASGGGDCPSSLAGKFMVIQVSQAYTPITGFIARQFLGGTLSDSAVVRIQ